jgi:hypothetical protein
VEISGKRKWPAEKVLDKFVKKKLSGVCCRVESRLPREGGKQSK